MNTLNRYFILIIILIHFSTTAERRDVDMTEFESLDINGLKLTPITFGNSSFIFSADVDLHSTGSRVKRQSASEDEDDRCVLMFVGGNDNIVLVTNPVK